MRMIICTGSERPIRQVLFNRDDDLLFAASVDGVVTLWNPETGERMGTYNGHRGAVNGISVDYISKYMISAGGDGSIRLWSVCDGKEIRKFEPNRNSVQSVDFNCGDKLFIGATIQLLGREASIHIYKNPMIQHDDDNDGINEKKDSEDYKINTIEIKNDESIKNFKASKVMWSPLNDQIYGGCSDGTIRIYDSEKGKRIKKIIFDPTFLKKQKTNKELLPDITDLQYCNGKTCIVATSRNFEARMFDLRNFECVKTYSTDRGLNTVAVHPLVNGIAIGGGKTAQEAALKRGKGYYDVILEHMVFEEKMGTIDPECFSPLNTMTFNSDGSLFVLGYEEGTVRIFKMDANFDEKWKKVEEKFTKADMDDDDDDEDE